MRKSILCAIACMGLLSAYAAPAPYPLTVNSRAQTAPPVLVYKANEAVFRVTFTDGDTPSDLTGCTPFMSWATNAAALVNSTSSVSVVGISTGLVDFTFSPSSVNYTAGRYVYEVGVLTAGGLPRVFRQGTFTIYDSPVGAGAGAIAWSTNVTWSSVAWIGLPDVTINGVVGNIKTSVVYTVTADSAQTAVVVTGVQSNLIAGAVQSNDARYLAALTNEADTLSSVAARGGFAGTETIAPYRVNAQRLGNLSGTDSTGLYYSAIGYNSGSGANGNSWLAVGNQAGVNVTGTQWVAVGYLSGAYALGNSFNALGVSSAYNASGDGFTAVGQNSGENCVGNNWSSLGFYSGANANGDYWTAVGTYAGYGGFGDGWCAFGNYAGYNATNNYGLFIDVYNGGEGFDEHNPTNDMIYGDNGQLNLGRSGALTNPAPNRLRGVWAGGENITGITAAQVGAVATNAVRTAGCTDLGSATNLIVTGNTGAFLAYPSADYGVSVADGSIFDGFSLTINSTNIPTYASNIYTQNAWTATARNILSFVPYTNGLWNVYGRGL